MTMEKEDPNDPIFNAWYEWNDTKFNIFQLQQSAYATMLSVMFIDKKAKKKLECLEDYFIADITDEQMNSVSDEVASKWLLCYIELEEDIDIPSGADFVRFFAEYPNCCGYSNYLKYRRHLIKERMNEYHMCSLHI